MNIPFSGSEINFTSWQFLNCVCQLWLKLWRQMITSLNLSLFQGHWVKLCTAFKLACFVSIYRISSFISQRLEWRKVVLKSFVYTGLAHYRSWFSLVFSLFFNFFGKYNNKCSVEDMIRRNIHPFHRSKLDISLSLL